MKNAPLISVVLPVYNVAPYIKEALDSVLNQTIQDFEIIVIDDCSTDNTLEVIESIKDVRIRIIKKPENKGLIDSLNIGFSEAKGKYIARMDGDDLNTPDRFEKQLHILQNKSEITACGCWLQCFDASNKIIKHKQHHKEIQAQLLLSNSMSLGATMLKTNAYTRFKFDDTKAHAEDYDFWAKTAWDSNLYNIQETLYHYRTHETQVSSLHNDFQKIQDVDIKLSLYHKINYNKIEFSDVFIKKMLFSTSEISVDECKLFFRWLNQLIQINKKQKVFGYKELSEVIDFLKRKLVFDLFFTNTREGIDYNKRKLILNSLPFKEKLFVVLKKVKERGSIIKKSKKSK
ncbi:MAG: hypothetical protein COZ17_02580 [Flavobacteriaceae bacterium CG_4_10_14_3_um_filter_33_47]|nr:MAG: hypothetical protein COZ17_02580 [Flavobacteriaceae bacterium CG_4_10_14_3_um_filter_33_47]PJB19871.1 MAG: hypothetical protein CO117_02975 [Flavobacteriaceae bacterium CG_4_9_14_3_um_filter_33_16]